MALVVALAIVLAVLIVMYLADRAIFGLTRARAVCVMSISAGADPIAAALAAASVFAALVIVFAPLSCVYWAHRIMFGREQASNMWVAALLRWMTNCLSAFALELVPANKQRN